MKNILKDDLYPGAWEFPGGYLEAGKTIKEEIGFNFEFYPIITHYFDEIKEKNSELFHDIEIDFIINVNKDDVNIKLSNEHCDFKWVTSDSELLDEYIKSKLSNI